MSVTAAAGFVASGIACGIKPSGAADLALVATADGAPVPTAAVFTSNKATAAPVQTSRSHLERSHGMACAVVLNSGNANAATGARGRSDAERTCELVAGELGCEPRYVLVCSTGLIGIPLPMAPIEAGVARLVASRSAEAGPSAARAIMTTDTVPKEVVVSAGGFAVGGMAKGAAMLSPDMATMLAVLTTDAAVDATTMQVALREAVAGSFNTMSVDGCTSTNDTVILLASGVAGRADPAPFTRAVSDACLSLARQMVADAEGATKVVTIEVVGAHTTSDAAKAARRVAESQLVKCSLYGEDPFWGRVVSELGSAGVAFDPDRVSVAYGGVPACIGGIDAITDRIALMKVMQAREITIHCNLGLGPGEARILTNDLTHAYIDENRTTS